MTVSRKKYSILELIRLKKLPDTITDTDLTSLIPGSIHRRYALVKRALARGDLIQVRRGLYVINELYRQQKTNTFELAQRIYGPSYVSLESALSYWGLIPEAVYTITNCCSQKSKEFRTPFGYFTYTRIPYQALFTQVVRKAENQLVYFIASPLRALTDYVYTSKKIWNVEGLEESLRLEEIPKITKNELNELNCFYLNWRVQKFLKDYARRISL